MVSDTICSTEQNIFTLNYFLATSRESETKELHLRPLTFKKISLVI